VTLERIERPTTPPKPPLSDGVVTLRAWRTEDVPALVTICNGDEEMSYWLDRLPQPYTQKDGSDYVLRAERGWRGEEIETPLAIVDAETGEVLGSCGVRWNDPQQGVAEVGYWTRREARGRGVATRALRLLAGWVLGTLSFERLELLADTRNEPSLRVGKKAGFRREGVIRSARTNARDGLRVDHALYSLLRSELVH
jgi:RimJ/RimL family protein N-acetyltransferase